jgi:hypothetical protein
VNPSTTEASDLDIPKLFRQIRSRYKAVCATMGVKPTLRGAGSSSVQEVIDDSRNGPPVLGDENNRIWQINDTRVSTLQKDYSF